jgi:hypothetical protein
LQAQISTLVPAPLPSVTIGTAIWQNINLDVTTYRDGTVIPQVRDANEWMDLKTGLGVIITMMLIMALLMANCITGMQ